MEEDPMEKEKEEAASSSSSYSSSPIHHLILLNDLPRLRSLFSSSLPKLLPPSQIHTPSESLHQLHLSSQASALLDNRDRVPNRDTPLHLAVRLNSPSPILRLLLLSGADPSLQNASGWTPLQLSLCLRRPKPLSLLLLRHHRVSAYAKFRRRLPLLLDRLAAVPDFYMELSFRFESSLIPFLSAVAPSDVYRCWKRGADLRVDTTLAGFDGLRVRRADQSFVFSGSAKRLVVLDRGRKQARDAFQGLDDEAAAAADDGEEDGLVEDASAYRPGLDITRAELVKVKNWRGKERAESVGEWKAKVYEVKDVVFSFKTMKAAREEEERLLELELDEDAEDGFLVAEIPPMPHPVPARRSCYERGRFGGVDAVLPPAVGVGKGRRSLDVLPEEGMRWEKAAAAAEVEMGGKIKEKELVKSLRPMVWLTEDFPLKTEELIPMLDILANKVKAVRRLRELLTTKFPPGTFPVKVSIPIVPTVRVIVTFTKFVNLQPSEEFFTPLSSPRHLTTPEDDEHRKEKAETGAHKSPWLRWSNSSAPKPSVTRPNSVSPSQVVNHVDPFSIPSDYTWVSMKDESKRAKKARSRKGNKKETV
ncbi:ankyrin repeat domain-containing protein 13C-like [Iris pallida]|uniref:Ankyrin repeat domain-containing protein 13C-like n=1 Tax=Iris pallida TaxID=29817 RepID=A0AAX6ICB7_IRIPA|nr:ankyrin repeat domain-containing protein 13C-like [Iris pallida]